MWWSKTNGTNDTVSDLLQRGVTWRETEISRQSIDEKNGDAVTTLSPAFVMIGDHSHHRRRQSTAFDFQSSWQQLAVADHYWSMYTYIRHAIIERAQITFNDMVFWHSCFKSWTLKSILTQTWISIGDNGGLRWRWDIPVGLSEASLLISVWKTRRLNGDRLKKQSQCSLRYITVTYPLALTTRRHINHQTAEGVRQSAVLSLSGPYILITVLHVSYSLR